MRKVIIENERGRVEFGNSRPFILEKIEGTSSAEVTNINTKAPGQNGVTLQGNTFNPRTLIMSIGIVGETKRDTDKLIRELTGVLNSRLNSKLIYSNDYKDYSIDCNVEAIEQGERIKRIQKLVVQLFCPNPFWSDIDELKEEVALWEGAFEFPLEIPEDTGIEMGYRVSNLIMNVVNNGDVECGMTIEFLCTGTVKNPSLFNVYTREFIKVNQTFIAGDKLSITTQFANKRIELTRAGATTNILHYMDINSTFLQLGVGDNVFRYDADEGIDNLEVSIYYKPQYLGV